MLEPILKRLESLAVQSLVTVSNTAMLMKYICSKTCFGLVRVTHRSYTPILLILICFLINACSTVRFNERERLAKADMQFNAEPLKDELESHIYSAREGASGSFSEGGGGGCGCY